MHPPGQAGGAAPEKPPRWRVRVSGYLRRPLHKLRARAFDTSNVKSLCMLLGPNRNLTTLTASTLALHPHMQVLNNAGRRFMPWAEPFLHDPTKAQYERVLRQAIYFSQGGRRGIYGGSIMHSHAFDRSAMREPYLERFGQRVLKPDVRCLLWKSAARLTGFVREHDIDLGEVARRCAPIRFLMPIRNPLHSALSNMKTGHWKRITTERDAGPAEVVALLVETVGWFLDLRKQHPDKFFCYDEASFGTGTLKELAAFLGLEPDARWLEACAGLQVAGGHYDYPPGYLAAYEAALTTHLDRHPEMQARLRAYATDEGPRGTA